MEDPLADGALGGSMAGGAERLGSRSKENGPTVGAAVEGSGAIGASPLAAAPNRFANQVAGAAQWHFLRNLKTGFPRGRGHNLQRGTIACRWRPPRPRPRQCLRLSRRRDPRPALVDATSSVDRVNLNAWWASARPGFCVDLDA
eukprot:scaffold5316_cov67-Phaeocystis_antarctica.AAC.1